VEVATVVHKDNAEVTGFSHRVGDKAAKHVVMPARLTHQTATHVIEFTGNKALLFPHGASRIVNDTTDDQPCRFALRMRIAGNYHALAHESVFLLSWDQRPCDRAFAISASTLASETPWC